MQLLKALIPYKKKLQKQYTEQIGRRQFNFDCDKRLILRLKALAQYLEIPLYPLTEHIIELGMLEVAAKVKDDALKEILQRHLIQDHLLVKELKPMDKEISARAVRIKNALKLLSLIELQGNSPRTIETLLDNLKQRLQAHNEEQNV